MTLPHMSHESKRPTLFTERVAWFSIGVVACIVAHHIAEYLGQAYVVWRLGA